MDRLRDASRRGSSTATAQISNLRRPRSSGGFKDSADALADEEEVMEDLHSGRLRERPRKECNTQLVARHKRTRHSSRELSSRVEEVEETEGGGPSDEDDLPISPNLLPRRPTKFRFHGKVAASNEVVAIDIPAVPRKARTAISKRPHEMSHGDGLRHQGFTSAPSPSTTVAPSHTPFGSSSKPMKRMKHTSGKIKVAKLSKVSAASVTISQQEVEVAEALFDLARMVSNLGSPDESHDEKMEVKTENSEMTGPARPFSPDGTPHRRQDSISTPQTSHSAVSSPVRGPIPVTSSHLSSTDGPTKKISLLKLKVEDGAISPPKKDLNGQVSDFKSVWDSCTGQSVGSNTPTDVKVNAIEKTGQESQQKAALSMSLLPLPSPSSVVADSNIPATEGKSSSSAKIPDDNIVSTEHCLRSDALCLTGFSEKTLLHGMGPGLQDACGQSALINAKTLKATHSCKYEIDLMASPNASASGASEKTGNSVDSGLVSNKDQLKERTESNQNFATRFVVDTLAAKRKKTSSGNEKEARVGFTPQDNHEHVKTEVIKESEREKQLEEVSKQEASDSHPSSKADTHQHHASGPGWAGSLPHLGYYPAAAAAAAAAAAVAAAWPATGSVIGGLPMEEKGHPSLLVPPLTFPPARPLCKHCAIHVYIAHFIDTQQQMQRHSIWAAAYANSASGSLYPMKTCNPNAPHFPPNVLFGGGLTGLTGLTVNNAPATNKGPSPEPGSQNNKGSLPASKEMLTSQNVDGSISNGGLQSLQPNVKKLTTASEAGSGLTSGFASAAHGNISLEGNIAVSKGNPGGGGSNAVAAYPDLAGASTGIATSTYSATTTAAQVQYLQAIIQQAGLPFPFSPGHLMPPSQGHLSQQQATPFFNNPFYNPPYIHPQQNSATEKVSPQTSSLQGQSSSMHKDVCVSQSLSQPSQQQQQFSAASSSHSLKRAASQHLQHFGDVEMNPGGETVSSAESKFPGYQKKVHSQENSIMHASNITSSKSAPNSAGLSALPVQVASAAKQMTNMKMPQSGQVQQHSPKMTPYLYPSGSTNIDFQSAQASPGMHMGGVSKNMVGPGPLGLAPVAAVMAPQGHTVFQTISELQPCHTQAYGDSYSKHPSGPTGDGSRALYSLGVADDKRLAKQGGPVKMDKESEGGVQGSTGYNSGLSSTTISGTSFNFMNATVGTSGSRQATPVSIGAVPSLGVTRANPNVNVTTPEQTPPSRMPSPSLLFHPSNALPNQGLRQGQAASHYSSQAKPASRTHVGTSSVGTAPSTLPPGSYAGVPATKQQSYPSKSHQVSMSSMQSRFPPTTSGPSGASVSPSTSVSKASGSAATKNIPAGKGSYNSLQKQNSAAPAKKPDMILTHLPGQVMGPSSITMNMGQTECQPQQQQSQHQMQHSTRQQQQHQHQWQQQQKQHPHQEHSQQVSQSMHQQFHITGVSPGVSMQYHQALAFSQAAQGGMHKLSAPSQQAKPRPYLEQNLYQPQQQQGHLTESQQNARMQQHFAQQNAVSAANRSLQLSEIQVNKQQYVSGHHQPLSLASYGAMSSAAAQTPASFSLGSGSGGKPACTDGNMNQVTSPASISMKPPGGIGASVGAPNIQRSGMSSMGIPHLQAMGPKVAEAKVPPQSSGTLSYLPYLQSATFSSGMVLGGQVLGASGVHKQSSPSMISMRDGSAEAGHESSSSHQYDNDKSGPASKAQVTSGHSVCAISAVKTPVSLPLSSATPLASHGPPTPGQSSQACTVTSAIVTADSVSTTG